MLREIYVCVSAVRVHVIIDSTNAHTYGELDPYISSNVGNGTKINDCTTQPMIINASLN